MHLVSLQQPAGVETLFSEFVVAAARRYPEWRHAWLNPARPAHAFLRRHSFFEESLRRSLTGVLHTKYLCGVKLPSRPRTVRLWHCRRLLREAGADVLLIWNRSAKLGHVVDAMGVDRCIHWEHGSAWFAGNERDRERYFAAVPRAIACSEAAARALRLLWDYRGDVVVCRNGLRPSLLPTGPVGKRFAAGPVRLGVAARLSPVKGVAVVLHAFKLLREQGFDSELEIAGEGPELESLRALAKRLGVAARVRFHGARCDMRDFYADLHALLHAPLNEPFGLVAIEAAAHGCPVVAARVDGLPEAVAEGVTGYCVQPTLPLSAYRELGGSLEGVPGQVYDPGSGEFRAPQAVDPSALAAAVTRLLGDVGAYERMSAGASAHVVRGFTFDGYIDTVMGVIDGLIAAR